MVLQTRPAAAPRPGYSAICGPTAQLDRFEYEHRHDWAMHTALTESAQAELLERVSVWLPGRRWFGGKGRRITDAKLCESTPLGGVMPGENAIVGVQLDGTDWQVYQVPFVRKPKTDPVARAQLIGPLGDCFLYDAAAESGAPALLGAPANPPEVDPSHTHGPGGASAPGLQAFVDPVHFAAQPACALTVEQSNTSLRLGDVALMKIFRQLTPGVNPDVEVHAALTRVGCQYIAAILGWTNGAWNDPATGDRVTGHLAMVQELVSPAVGGWDLALEKVAAGVDFTQESYQLGRATGAVHRDLQRALPTRRLTGPDLAALMARLHARLDRAAAVVPEIAQYEDALHAGIAGLGAYRAPVQVQRVHGDLHLGQVLQSGQGWKLLDFEGEPGAAMAARVLLDHPLRDVAGMLRSFAYAARVGGEHGRPDAMNAWREACERAFLRGYTETGVADPAESAVILRAYLIDKAAYEAVYETRNRPDWLEVPLAALRALAG